MRINVAMTWGMFQLQSVCIQKVLLWILRHFSFIKVLIKMIPQERQKVIIINEQQTDTSPFNSLAPLCPFKNAIIMWGGKTDTSNGCISEIIQLIACEAIWFSGVEAPEWCSDEEMFVCMKGIRSAVIVWITLQIYTYTFQLIWFIHALQRFLMWHLIYLIAACQRATQLKI